MIKFFFLSFCALLVFPFSLSAQFHIDTLAQGNSIDFPVAMAFPPDSSGKMFFTEKNSGKVRIFQNDILQPNPFLTVPVATAGEQGMIGVTFHPQYPDSPYVYVFYTRSSDRANMVVRYKDVANTATDPDTLLIVGRATPAVYHNGGNIHFGPDGKLYVAIGDYSVSSYAQDTSRTNRRGKINRINYDGSIPADNPITGSTIYSYGHRNPFDFTFDPVTGKMYVSENGPSCNDEINLIVPRANYGWPVDGNCTYGTNPKYTKPLYYWPTNIPSFTGIVVYRDTVFPELYGKMLVTSYNYGKIYMFSLNEAGDSILSGPTPIFSFGSGLTDVEVGPNGLLYVTNGTYEGIKRVIRLSPPTSVPTTPLLHLPEDNSENQPTSLTLRWGQNPEVKFFHVQVSLDSLFTTILAEDSTLRDTLFTLDSLENYTTFYWRVRANNNIGTSDFSSTQNFKTLPHAPEVPDLVYPPDDALIELEPVTFLWNTSGIVTIYRVQISEDSLFSSTILDTQVVSDTLLALPSLFTYDTYYWRVRASNISDTTEYSTAGTFTIRDPLKFSYAIANKWNLLSLPHSPFEHTKEELFPSAVSHAFTYSSQAGYIMQDTLVSGKGYWLRFDSTEQVSYRGEPIFEDTIEVNEGWNLIGAIADTVQIGSLISNPDSILTSEFYYYDNGYYQANELLPGKAYWVKSLQNGIIIVPSAILRKQSSQNRK